MTNSDIFPQSGRSIFDKLTEIDDTKSSFEEKFSSPSISKAILIQLHDMVLLLENDGHELTDKLKQKINEQKRMVIKSINNKQKEVEMKLKKKKIQFQINLQKNFRKIITGSEQRSVRRFMTSVPTLMTIDKACFTFSVIHVLLSELFLLKLPEYFKYYYSIMLIPLILYRYIVYKSLNYQYFLFDFCYFVNLVSLLEMYLFDTLFHTLFKTVFCLSNGPILFAIVVWRNSMVFHDVDKMTSLFIHCFPPLCSFVTKNIITKRTGINEDHTMNFKSWILFPTLTYMMWQTLYLIKTEYVDKDKLKRDPTLQTSLKWLANDEKNGMNKLVKKVCIKYGILNRTEKFDSDQIKTKIIFVITNFVYFIITILPTYILYKYKYLHFIVMLICIFMTIFNGANYYIEIFASRYNASLKQKQDKMDNQYKYIDENLDRILRKKWDELESDIDIDDSYDNNDNRSSGEESTKMD